MKLWTYRFPVTVAGVRYELRFESGMTHSRLLLAHEGQTLEDGLNFTSEPYRLHRISLPTAQGELIFELGPRSAWNYGVRATLDGQQVYQSHPDPFAYLPRIQQMQAKRKPMVDQGIDFSRMKSQTPALAADIALGILFFVLGKTTDLRTAALVTAGAGLAMLPIQWAINRWASRKVDILGGMALFGIVILLLSAGFSWYFDSEFAVQLKATVIGTIVALCFGVDALMGGKRLGLRFSNYLVYKDLNLRRLSAGMCLMGLLLAGVNLAVATFLSKDAWLWYTLWGDLILVMILTNVAIHWSRPKPGRQALPA